MLPVVLAVLVCTLTPPPAPRDAAPLPLLFEANGGRYDASVRFIARAPSHTVLLTGDGATMLLEGTAPDLVDERGAPRLVHVAAVRTTFVDASPAPATEGLDAAATRVHHIRGSDPADWSLDNPTFTRVAYRELWPGVDLELYDAGGRLEYDFVVAPGADTSVIRLAYDGVDDLLLRDDGALVLRTAAGDVVHTAPILYQRRADAPDVREPVAGRFELRGAREVGFSVGAWDTSRPLVIDPVMVYASLIGGATTDYLHDVAADAAGRAYVVGQTISADLPATVGALDTLLADTDAFVARFSADGTALEWCTYLGGASPIYTTQADDRGYTIEVDDAGLVYVGGETLCGDFPTTADAIKPTQPGFFDGFVSVLSADGSSLVYSTLLGGQFGERIFDLCVTDSGRIYVTGDTAGGFPVTPNAFQPVVSGGAPNEAFFAWFTPGGPLEYSSHLAGTGACTLGSAIEVDAAGRVYVGGATATGNFPTTAGGYQQGHGGSYDAFVCRFDPTGTVLEYGTYLGGPNNDAYDSYVDLAIDDDGKAWVVATAREGYPTSAGAFLETSPTFSPAAFGCGVLTCLDTDLAGPASMVFSTFMGSPSPSGMSDVDVDAAGTAWIFGWADGATFPVLEPWDPELGYGTGNDLTDAVLASFDATGALLSSTFVGGSGLEPNVFAPATHGGFELGPDGSLFLVQTQSAGSVGLPTPGAFQTASAGGAESWVVRMQVDDPVCQTDLGFDGPGDGTLSLCGSLDTGTFSVLRLDGFDPGFVQLVVGLSSNPAYVPALDATLVPLPLLLIVSVPTDSAGEAEAYVPGGAGPATVYVQAIQPDNPNPGEWTVSNALEIEFGP